jgi:hypothetical protein
MNNMDGVTPESPTGNVPESVSEDAKTPEKQPEVKEESQMVEDKEEMIPYSRFKQVVKERELLESRVKELETLPPSEEAISQKYPDWDLMDEGQRAIALRQEALEKELKELKARDAWEKSFSKTLDEFPDLKESVTEFKDYCQQNPTTSISTLAKSFLFDKKPIRKGLEKPTGGEKTMPTSGFTTEEVKRIRETDEKLFEKLVREGRIDTRKLK